MSERRCVLITGAVRNSGLGIARKFLGEGWATFITSRVQADAETTAAALAKEFDAPCIGLGFSPLHAIEETHTLFERIEAEGYALDSLVCTAADLGRWMDPVTVDPIAWENVLLTNVVGYFMPAREAVKQMVNAGKADHGTIVFVGSINYRDALPERSAYVASKGAIRSMTKALALDFAKYGVRVNCIAPGPIWTTRYEEMIPEEADRRRELVPLKCITTAEQMGNVTYFLATDTSSNMTGSVLIIDGGMDSIVAGGY